MLFTVVLTCVFVCGHTTIPHETCDGLCVDEKKKYEIKEQVKIARQTEQRLGTINLSTGVCLCVCVCVCVRAPIGV